LFSSIGIFFRQTIFAVCHMPARSDRNKTGICKTHARQLTWRCFNAVPMGCLLKPCGHEQYQPLRVVVLSYRSDDNDNRVSVGGVSDDIEDEYLLAMVTGEAELDLQKQRKRRHAALSPSPKKTNLAKRHRGWWSGGKPHAPWTMSPKSFFLGGQDG
jgi:hypothetical protein